MKKIILSFDIDNQNAVTNMILCGNKNIFYSIKKKFDLDILNNKIAHLNNYEHPFRKKNLGECSLLLNEIFFDDYIESCIEAQKDVFILIDHCLEFQEIPFEITNVKGKLLLENAYIQYLVRGKIVNMAEVKNKPSILIIADPIQNLDVAYSESIKLYDFLTSKEINTCFGSIDFVSKKLSLEEIYSFFEKYDIIHFTGHGNIHDETKYGWHINDNLIFNGEYKSLIQKISPPFLIFSNACLTAQTLQSGYSFHKNLLEKGITNVIASSISIPEVDFSEFTIAFYQNLCKNTFNTAKAYKMTVNALYKKNNIDFTYFKMFSNHCIDCI